MDTLASRLEKVKSTMDNGAFLFKFKKSSPIAVHRDWLFKEYSVNKVIKKERIKSIFFENKVGILYNSGVIVIPKGEETEDINEWIKITPPDVDGDKGVKVKDEFTSFVYFTNGNIHATTKLNKLYKFTKSEAETLSESNLVTIEDNVCTPLELYGDSEGAFLRSAEGNFYYIGDNTKGQSTLGKSVGDTIESFTITSLESQKIDKIFLRYKRTFVLYTSGTVKVCGDNSLCSAGFNNNQDTGIETLSKILNSEYIIDIAIGKYNTYFLNENYQLIGIGSNIFNQLNPSEDIKIEENISASPIYFDTNYYFRSICATTLGFVGVTTNGRLVHQGGFLNGEMGYDKDNISSDQLISSQEINGETYNDICITKNKKPSILYRQYIKLDDNDSESLVSVVFNSVFNTGFGVLISREDGKCLFTGKNVDYFLNSNMGENIKTWTSIENDKNDIKREYKTVTNNWSFYHDIINNWDKFNGGIEAIYYKNDNGKWINYSNMMTAYAGNSNTHTQKDESGRIKLDTSYIYNLANSESVEKSYSVISDNFPQIKYTDDKGTEYIINKSDGYNKFNFSKNIFYDTLNDEKFEIELFNRKYETTLGSQPYLQHRNDIKLKLKSDDYTFDNFLTWINGTFPRFERYSDNKSMYILNGTSFIPTIRKCENIDTPVTLKTEGLPTVVEPEVPTELRWDFDIKLFGWDGVLVSNPEDPLMINNERFSFTNRYFDIPSSLIFEEELEEDTFILLMNGVVMNENSYSISSVDKRKIYLNDYSSYILGLFIELVGKEVKTNYFDRLKDVVTSNKFTIVRFKSEDSKKIAKVYRDRENIRNSPYPGQVSFKEVNYNDLILVDGHYIPYIWENFKSIRYPDSPITLKDSENDFINFADIYRLLVYLEDK